MTGELTFENVQEMVSFKEYCLFYRALLQKRPVILRSLLLRIMTGELTFENVQEIVQNLERHCLCYVGWLRLVSSIKLLVSFTEYRLFYRALLQKRPLIFRRLLIVATPYVCVR